MRRVCCVVVPLVTHSQLASIRSAFFPPFTSIKLFSWALCKRLSVPAVSDHVHSALKGLLCRLNKVWNSVTGASGAGSSSAILCCSWRTLGWMKNGTKWSRESLAQAEEAFVLFERPRSSDMASYRLCLAKIRNWWKFAASQSKVLSLSKIQFCSYICKN